MNFYKDAENKVHCLDSSDFEDLLPAGCVSITAEEAAALEPLPTANELIIRQITGLEATVTPRRIREAVLGIDNGWLAALNTQVAALRDGLS